MIQQHPFPAGVEQQTGSAGGLLTCCHRLLQDAPARLLLVRSLIMAAVFAATAAWQHGAAQALSLDAALAMVGSLSPSIYYQTLLSLRSKGAR